MISDNPTKTRGIEKAWRREINKRWRQFTREVIAELKRVNQITVNAFDVDPIQLRAYIAFFQQKINELLNGDWQNTYQLRAYELAIDRAMQSLRASGARTAITRTDRELAARIESFTATSSLGISAVDVARFPIHQEALSFLFTRSFESLEGFNSTMSRQVRQILFDSVEQGLGVAETVRLVKERIAVSRSRARLIAQTETIQAYQRGTINQAQLAQEQLGETVKLRWLTRRDAKVRPLHVGFHGQIMTQKEARRNIAISPYNCRCALSAIIKESDTPEKTAKFKKEKRQLEALTP
jgi:SPP1 gp7 family putative phage head morphogenesis protein